MRKVLQKSLATITAATMAVCMAATVSAKSEQYKVGKGTMTATLDVSSSSAYASTSIDVGPCYVSVSIYGQYYVKGTTTVRDYGNGNSSNTSGTEIRISNGGGTWIKVYSTHSTTCGQDSKTVTLNW